jgi:hypothetical protein
LWEDEDDLALLRLVPKAYMNEGASRLNAIERSMNSSPVLSSQLHPVLGRTAAQKYLAMVNLQLNLYELDSREVAITAVMVAYQIYHGRPKRAFFKLWS